MGIAHLNDSRLHRKEDRRRSVFTRGSSAAQTHAEYAQIPRAYRPVDRGWISGTSLSGGANRSSVIPAPLVAHGHADNLPGVDIRVGF